MRRFVGIAMTEHGAMGHHDKHMWKHHWKYYKYHPWYNHHHYRCRYERHFVQSNNALRRYGYRRGGTLPFILGAVIGFFLGRHFEVRVALTREHIIFTAAAATKATGADVARQGNDLMR